MADELVKEAEQKRDKILQQAEVEAQDKIAGIQKAAEAEEYRLQQAQKNTASFVQQVQALHMQAQSYLQHLSELVPSEELHLQQTTVEQAASEIDDNVQRLVAQAMVQATAENQKNKLSQEQQVADLGDTTEFPCPKPTKTPQEDPLLEQTTRIDFGELQFGREYEIK